jgi:serine/threonine-protein kinase
MPQYIQDRNSDWQRTLHGFGHLEESPPLGGVGEPGFVRIGERVGRSGQVFETEDGAGLGRRVVKLYTWGAGLPDRVVHEFTRDVMTVANLRHPHIVEVVDAGTLGDGTPFVVMERLAGMTLEEAAGGRSLRTGELLPILRGVASALAAAHAAGVAHGALRAEDVFMAEVAGYGRGFPKLLDFGVARLAAGARAIGRPVGEVAGTGPLLELGGRAGERADQLALAGLAWRLLGGAAAPAVQRVLARAMSPDPSQRFGSVTSLVDALDEASTSAPVHAPSAATVTTLLGSAAAISSSIGAPVIASSAPPLAPVALVAPVAAVPVPSSLTQQFFAEGERQEAAHAAGLAHAQSDDGEGDEAKDEGASSSVSLPRALARVPRSRAQMTVAALLAVGSVAAVGFTVASLAGAHRAGGPLAVASAQPAVVPSPMSVAPARAAVPGAVPAPSAIDRGTRGPKVNARRPSRVEPPPFPAAARPAPVSAPVPAGTAAAAPALGAPPTPGALPPVGLPSAPGASPPAPASAAVAVPAPGSAPAPGAAPAAPIDEDVTQPWEQTEGESAKAPARGGPSEAAPGSSEAAPGASEAAPGASEATPGSGGSDQAPPPPAPAPAAP